jgi:hypothetical protein
MRAYFLKLASIKTVKGRVAYANAQADIITPAQQLYSSLIEKYCIQYPDEPQTDPATSSAS